MIERLARLGYVSIGVVYIVAGLLAATAGLGLGGSTGGQKGAFVFILRQPFGRVFLAIIAVGLLGYTLWRLVSGVSGNEAPTRGAKNAGSRIVSISRGLFYGAIAIEVIHLMFYRDDGRSGDAKAQHWTGRLMNEPYGRWLVLAGGLAVVGAGAYQLYKAFESKLGKRLHLGELDDRVRRKVIAISRFGIAARGVVMLVVGVSLVIAGFRHNPEEAHATSGALKQLAETGHGLPLVLVGAGLAAYGIFAFANARYRSIRA